MPRHHHYKASLFLPKLLLPQSSPSHLSAVPHSQLPRRKSGAVLPPPSPSLPTPILLGVLALLPTSPEGPSCFRPHSFHSTNAGSPLTGWWQSLPNRPPCFHLRPLPPRPVVSMAGKVILAKGVGSWWPKSSGYPTCDHRRQAGHSHLSQRYFHCSAAALRSRMEGCVPGSGWAEQRWLAKAGLCVHLRPMACFAGCVIAFTPGAAAGLCSGSTASRPHRPPRAGWPPPLLPGPCTVET